MTKILGTWLYCSSMQVNSRDLYAYYARNFP